MSFLLAGTRRFGAVRSPRVTERGPCTDPVLRSSPISKDLAERRRRCFPRRDQRPSRLAQRPQQGLAQMMTRSAISIVFAARRGVRHWQITSVGTPGVLVFRRVDRTGYSWATTSLATSTHSCGSDAGGAGARRLLCSASKGCGVPLDGHTLGLVEAMDRFNWCFFRKSETREESWLTLPCKGFSRAAGASVFSPCSQPVTMWSSPLGCRASGRGDGRLCSCL